MAKGESGEAGMKQNLKIIVSGKVQGVFYRAFIKEYAEKFGIEGTAQNADDGTVVVCASASSDKLDEFIDVLYKGSPKASVEDVIVEPLIKGKDFRGVFRVIGEHK
jgi:acylphosphatase